MGGLIRGQWVDNGLEMIWGLIGSVWFEYRVMAWSMALWLVGEGVMDDMDDFPCPCSSFSTRSANLVCNCFDILRRTLAPSGYARRRVGVVMASKLHLGDLSGGKEVNFNFWSYRLLVS